MYLKGKIIYITSTPHTLNVTLAITNFKYFFLFAVKNGYSCVPIALTEGLDIRVNTAVNKIKYFKGGVEVTAENLKTNDSSMTYKGE